MTELQETLNDLNNEVTNINGIEIKLLKDYEKKEEKRPKLDYVHSDVFDTFYEDYLEFKNYVNDILKETIKADIEKSKEEELNHKDGDIEKLERQLFDMEEDNKLLSQENSSMKEEIKSLLKIVDRISNFTDNNIKSSKAKVCLDSNFIHTKSSPKVYKEKRKIYRIQSKRKEMI